MSRVTKKAITQYPLLARLIFWAQKLKYGTTLEPAWYWGRSPKLLYGLQVFYRCLDRKQSPLSRRLRALVSNRIAQVNACAFCMDISASALQNQAVTFEILGTLGDYESNSNFLESERAALAYAEAMTDSTQRVSNVLFQRLGQSFSEEQIVELTAWIAFQNLSSKFNAALDISAQGFCKITK